MSSSVADISIPGFLVVVKNGREYLVPTDPKADCGDESAVDPNSPIPGFSVVIGCGREYLVAVSMVPVAEVALAVAQLRNHLRVSATAD